MINPQLDNLQASAINKLERLKAGALFMKMGAGKTKTAINLAELRHDKIDLIIWFAPASALASHDYIAEVNRWRVTDIPVRFFSIEGVSQSDRNFMRMHRLANINRCFCVIDESLAIKNHDAKRTKRLISMWSDFEYRLILNGTPVTKSIMDMHMQMEFLHPRILNMREAQFARNFMVYRRDEWRGWRRWSKPENEAALMAMIEPYVFCADLEMDKRLNDERIDLRLTNSENAAYEEMKKSISWGEDSAFNFLAIAQKCQHFYTLCSEKLAWLEAEIKARTSPLLIFVKYHDEIDAIKRMADCVEFSGRQKPAHPSAEFQDKGLMVATYGTGSQTHNWQFCHDMIMASPTFDYWNYSHSIHRVYRPGQQHDVNLRRLFCNTGLDQMIAASLVRKDNLLRNVKKEIMKKGVAIL